MFAVAASALLPGAGHLLTGRRRRAMVFFAIDGALLLLVLWLYTRGTVGVLQLLVQPQWVRAAVVGNLAVWVFRLVAVADVMITERPEPNRALGAAFAALLMVVLVAPHVMVMTRSLSLLGVLETVFPDEGYIAAAIEQRRLEVEAERAAGAQGPVTTLGTTSSTVVDPNQPDGAVVPDFTDPGGPELEPIELNRITVLLAGGDAGPGRSGLRTDTMIIASLDVETGEGILITVSRELTGFPLPEKLQELPSVVERQELIWEAAVKAEVGGYTQATELLPEERDPAMWLDRINAVYPFTYQASDVYRGARRPGMSALRDTLEEGLGIQIDYYVLVDFAGFVDLVDAIGGVTITSRETMDIRMSPAKPGEEDLILHITPGRHHLDGRSALVYVRNRTDTSDVVRTRRQRCFVREVVGQVQASTVISRFDRIARAIRNYAITDIPVGVLPDLIQVVAGLDTADIATMAVEPGYLAETRNYRGLPVLNVERTQARIREVMRGIHSGAPTVDARECGF